VNTLAVEALSVADDRLPSPIVAVVFLALGPPTLYGAYAAWTGRWRSWVWSISWLNYPLTLLPSFGCLLVGGGIGGVFPSTATAILAAPFFVVGFVLMPLIVFMPLDFVWFGPRWYRDHKRTERGLRRERRAQRREERARRKHEARSAVGDGGREA